MSDSEIGFMQWLVQKRSENQACCLELHALLTQHQDRWAEKQKYFLTSQALVGAAFSLWRAVFLADKKQATTKAVVAHSVKFLESVVLDNAISYVTDKSNNESTFNYYVDSARYRLIFLTNEWPKLLGRWEYKKRSPRPRWEYNQFRLSDAVKRFGLHMGKPV